VRLTKLYSGDEIKMRWAGYVARFGERRCAYMVLVMMPKGKEHAVDERAILKKDL
jgi:hypothetical protein